MADAAHPQLIVQGSPPAEPLWDDWERPPRVLATALELHLNGFDGPLDLLLDLAERQRIDLGRISMLDLVEQFGAALDRLCDRVPLERRADWLVLATRLVLLRSQLLLPASPEVAAAAEAAVTGEAARLEALLQVRAAVRWLEARPQLGRDVFEGPQAPSPWRHRAWSGSRPACWYCAGRAGRLSLRPSTGRRCSGRGRWTRRCGVWWRSWRRSRGRCRCDASCRRELMS